MIGSAAKVCGSTSSSESLNGVAFAELHHAARPEVPLADRFPLDVGDDQQPAGRDLERRDAIAGRGGRQDADEAAEPSDARHRLAEQDHVVGRVLQHVADRLRRGSSGQGEEQGEGDERAMQHGCFSCAS